MDVAMSIASALSEIHAANPVMDRHQLFRSGMNIGRDMVGTMTNTLILAFFGSSFTLILYLFSLGLQTHQLLSSAFLASEVISGISSSIGVILSVPITVLVSSALFANAEVKPQNAAGILWGGAGMQQGAAILLQKAAEDAKAAKDADSPEIPQLAAKRRRKKRQG